VGKRGPKPAPKSIKIARGHQRCRINFEEPRVPSGVPEVPSMVAENPLAFGEWRRLVPLLLEMNVLSAVDGAALGLYCLSFARWVEAEAEIKAGGLVLETANGNLHPSPYVGISERAMDRMRRFLAEFGLTPSSRSTVKAAPKLDELASFVKSRKA
jgi:P27 family predicted phage terminase small subunit